MNLRIQWFNLKDPVSFPFELIQTCKNSLLTGIEWLVQTTRVRQFRTGFDIFSLYLAVGSP